MNNIESLLVYVTKELTAAITYTFPSFSIILVSLPVCLEKKSATISPSVYKLRLYPAIQGDACVELHINPRAIKIHKICCSFESHCLAKIESATPNVWRL